MNHVHLSLFDYLWASHAVTLPQMICFVLGMLKVWAIEALRRVGLLRRSDPAEVGARICDLLLETSLSTHLQSLLDTDPSCGGATTATFVFDAFPIFVNVLPACHLSHGTKLEPRGRGSVVVLKLNLTTRQFVAGTFDSAALRAEDTLLLLGFHISTFTHPQIHAFANWAIDPADHQNHQYLRLMSVVTTVFNHAGLVGNPAVMSMLYSPAHGREVASVFGEAMRYRPPAHPQARKLLKYSKLVAFLIRLRPAFFRLFKKHSAAFPDNYSAEAYFLGTVLHSLEHAMFERAYSPVATGCTEVSPEYHGMSCVMKVIRNCFIEDLPCAAFHCTFKRSAVQFHKEVYSTAVKINPDLAELIHTTIVK